MSFSGILGAVFGEIRARIGVRVADRIVPAGVPTTYVLSLVILRIAAALAPAGPRRNAALSAGAELQLDREQSRELRPLRVACPLLVSCTGALTSELAALPRIVWIQVAGTPALAVAVANGVWQDVSL